MRSILLMLLLTTLLAGAIAKANYEAHEWGTFTSVVGSDGITQTGLYHEDEPLPDFVHGFGELRAELPPPPPPFRPPPHLPPSNPKPPCRNVKVCFDLNDLEQNAITQKMETPVIYFYSSDSTRQQVEVDVAFPEGIITETFPGPVQTFPTFNDPHVIANGKTKFSVDILSTKTGAVPFVQAGNIYGHARAVNSNVVTSGAETEKFIFYRGLGRFQPRISITSRNGALLISELAAARPQAAVLIHVDQSGHGQLLAVDSVKNKDYVTVSARRIADLKNHATTSPFIIRGEQARGKLVDELVTSGLFRDEALAMVNTWENGYLKVPGLRLLYILPQAEVDDILPLSFSPAPTNLVRSFVARMEILLDTEEARILEEIRAAQNTFKVDQLGRFAEPILRRVRDLAAKTEPTGSALLTLIDRFIKEAQNGSGGTLH